MEIISKFRKAIPEIAVRTTLISGFPGETAKDFNALKQLVKTVKFDRLGVFTYSHEENGDYISCEESEESSEKTTDCSFEDGGYEENLSLRARRHRRALLAKARGHSSRPYRRAFGFFPIIVAFGVTRMFLRK